MTGNNFTFLGGAIQRAIDAEAARRMAENNAKQVQAITAKVDAQQTEPVANKESTQETNSLTGRITPYISMAKSAALKVATQVRPTLEQVRTNLSSFYASFDMNQYVDTNKLKLNASACYRISKAQGFSFYATALSYSEKFLGVVQEIYTQVVDKFSNRSK